MGLETGTYISDLVASNPVNATDQVGEGDDHMRLIKSTILNTFPNITGEVSLSHTQLNDAALKSAANIFSAANTFNAVTAFGENATLENTKSLRAKDSGGVDHSMVFVSGSDIARFGASTLNAEFNMLQRMPVIVGGLEVARIVERASGGLQIADSGGVLGKVVAEHITANFTAAQNFKGVLNAQNDLYVGGDGTLQQMRLYNADQSKRLTLRHDNTQSRVISSDGNLSLEVPLGDTVTVDDLGGVSKKVGFRNPTYELLPDTDHVATLEDEQKTLACSGSTGRTIFLNNLGINTCFDIINRTAVDWTIEPGAALALQWLDGAGGQSAVGAAGARTLGPGSVAHVYQILSNQWELWGNGIT